MELSRLVPGFGETAAVANLPGFGVDAGSIATSQTVAKAVAEASEWVNSQVDRVLSQYDANRDSILDNSEIGKVEWGQPGPQESDLNRDGRLTREELVMRYRQREVDNQRV